MKSLVLPVFLGLLPSLSCAEILLQKNGILVDRTLSTSAKKDPQGNPLLSDPAGDDIVLFENGDVMHGTFGGINNGLLWERRDIERPIRFGLPSVRQIVRKGGRNVELHSNTSYVTLVSGDRIPGEIVSLDEQSLLIRSAIAGDLAIPRSLLKSISPNPFDGDLYYSGPYSSDGWVILGSKSTAGAKTEKGQEAKPETPPANEEEPPEKDSPWIHSGASFYNLGSAPLAFPDADLPDTGRLGFRAEWKGRLNLTLALVSDFTRPVVIEKKDDEAKDDPPAALQDEPAGKGADPEEKPDAVEPAEEGPRFREERLADLRDGNLFQTVPWLGSDQSNNALRFGSGYSLTLFSSYPYLSRNSFTEEGEPVSARMSTGRSSISLSEQGDADIEIRYDRKKALIMLYINGNYAAQWNDLGGFPGKGSGLALLNTSTASRVKISEITITSWNGMKDNAKSMIHPERDVTLLVNGTDRFSGKLVKIADGVAYLKSEYLDAEIPVTDISEIIMSPRSADGGPDDAIPDELTWKDDPLTVLYKPFGLIHLNPTASDGKTLSGTSPFLGEIKLDLTSSSLLRFTDGSPDLSDWFDDL